MPTSPALFRHWIEHVRPSLGSVYGRRVYELMRYWDEDDPDWSEAARLRYGLAAPAEMGRVAVLKSVGPSAATLVEGRRGRGPWAEGLGLPARSPSQGRIWREA